jgi:hypothetical protein
MLHLNTLNQTNEPVTPTPTPKSGLVIKTQVAKKLWNLKHSVFDDKYQEFQNKVYVQLQCKWYLVSDYVAYQQFYSTKNHKLESENSFTVIFAKLWTNLKNVFLAGLRKKQKL